MIKEIMKSEIDFVLPDAAIDLLRSYSERTDTDAWDIGDLVLSLADELCKRRGDQQRLVRRVAIEAGADESTMRDRLSMARFYEPADRSECDFSYSQFRALKSAGDAWRDYANWALKSADDYGGKPAPASVIRERIKADKAGEPVPKWQSRLESIVRQCDAIRRDDTAPQVLRDTLCAVADSLGEFLGEA